MSIGSSCRLQALSCIPVLCLSGCMMGSGDDPGLVSAIKGHYAAHATEEQGACTSPKIDTIQEHRRLEAAAEGAEIVQVRYSYFDRHVDMDAAWDKLVSLNQPCGGIAERRFALTKGELGYRVTGMSGERRSGESAR